MWGGDTFYGLLASLRGRLFRDENFAAFYCVDNGQDSVPSSLLATALLLQAHDKVSDAEAQADGQRVEQRHSSVSEDGSLVYPIQFLRADHPEVQQAWERTKRAWECVVELRRQLREWRP